MVRRYSVLSIFCLLAVSSLALGVEPSKNSGRPAGREIQEQARQMTYLHKYFAAHQYADGKWVRFTPADLHATPWEQVEKGCVLGRLELGKKGEETGLAPGTYDVFAKHVNGQWMIFFESNGMIDKDAVKVEYFAHPDVQIPKLLNDGQCVEFSHFRFCF
jgi:hypothetical protein